MGYKKSGLTLLALALALLTSSRHPTSSAVGARGQKGVVTDGGYEALKDPNLTNPERGVYYWDPRPDDPHTLVAEWLYLGDYCDKELAWKGHHAAGTSGPLNDYADRLARRREAGLKVVFRPRYDVRDDDGRFPCGVLHAKTEQLMKGHVDAVAAMLAEFKDVVAFVEAGYLGRWGEWNWEGFKADDAPVLKEPASRRAFLAYVVDAYRRAGLARHVAVRRPVFAKEMAEHYPALSAFISHHNDCFMTDETDKGTYSLNFNGESPDVFPSVEAARQWLRAASAETPFGGETCGGLSEKPRWADCKKMSGAKSEPAALRMSYLHAGYAEEAKPTWEKKGCYREIKSRLGYRFEVVSVTYPKEAPQGAPVTVRVRLRNTGWARMHNPRRAYLILSGAGAAYAVGGDVPGFKPLTAAQTSGGNVRDWLPGAEAAFEQTFTPPAGRWELGVMLPDPDRPDLKKYAVGFASARKGQKGRPLLNPSSGVNALGLQLNVTQTP